MAHFLFVLRDNDNENATRCFQFAKIAHGKGQENAAPEIQGELPCPLLRNHSTR